MKQSKIAFFDVDETLIDLKSMFSFRAFYLHRLWGPERGAKAEAEAARRIEHYLVQGRDRSAINALFYEVFRNHLPESVTEIARLWYAQQRVRPGFFIQPALKALQDHQQRGDEVAFVSGSAVQILAPLADELGVRQVLANRLEVRDGHLTGQLIPPQTIGSGKREAAVRLMQQLGCAAADCAAYGDHLSDLALLQSVGNPTVVARDPALIAHARQQGWPILYPHGCDAQGAL